MDVHGRAGEGDHHAGRADGDVVLVRRHWRTTSEPLRHLRVGVVGGRVERSRLHGAIVRDKPALGQKVGVAADEALVEAVDGAPLREHPPSVAHEGGAARRIAAVGPPRRRRWWHRGWRRRRERWARKWQQRRWRWRAGRLEPVVQHVSRPADLRWRLLESNPCRPRRGVDRDDVWVWERREAFALPGPRVDLSARVVVDGSGAADRGLGGAGKGDHHLRRPDGDVVLVRRTRSVARKPLRHLSIRLEVAVIESVRCHGAVAGDEPPLRHKVVVAADEALAKAVDGAPLGEHLPAVALERGSARRVTAIGSTGYEHTMVA